MTPKPVSDRPLIAADSHGVYSCPRECPCGFKTLSRDEWWEHRLTQCPDPLEDAA